MSLQDKSIAIFGAGNMGRALLKMALAKGARVILFDKNLDMLNAVSLENSEYITSKRLSLTVTQEDAATINLPLEINAIIIAISWHEGRRLIHSLASQDSCPVIVLGRPDLNDPLIPTLAKRKHPILLGTGLEPGLMESISSHILEQHPHSHTIESYCGGLPANPVGPFGYRLTFGRKLPIDPRLALTIRERQRFSVPRFSEVRHQFFPTLGLLEAFDDAMLATTAEHFQKHVVNFTQSTLRWPGFSQSARACQALGLLSPQRMTVGDLNTCVRDLADTLLTTVCHSDETESEDFVLCKWQHVDQFGEKGELIIKASQSDRDISAMAFMTCAFAMVATQFLFEKELTGIIYPHEKPATLIGVKFLQEIEKIRHVQITTSGTLTSIITEAA